MDIEGVGEKLVEQLVERGIVESPADLAHLGSRREGRRAAGERYCSDRGQLFRVHLDTPALYARARRLFGTWAAALAAAGLNHRAAVAAARERSLETRRRRTGRSR